MDDPSFASEAWDAWLSFGYDPALDGSSPAPAPAPESEVGFPFPEIPEEAPSSTTKLDELNLVEADLGVPEEDDDGTARIITSLGAVMDEKSAAGHRLRAAAASLGGAKLASIDFDDEEDDLDESSVASAGQTSDDASDSELANAGDSDASSSHHRSRRGSRADRSDASSSHRHSRSRSKRSRRDASSRGWKSEDAAYLTPRDIKKHAHASDERLSAEFLRTLPKSVRETEEAYQRWSRLKPEDAVEAPSDVGSYRDADSTRVSSSKTTSSSASSAKSGAARRSSSSSASSSVARAAADADAAAAAAAATRLEASAMEPRDETAYGSFILAPLSVIGVGGVVVIAILLVRNRRARTGSAREREALLGGGKPSAPDAHPPDSSSNLRVLFASAGVHPGHPYSTLPGGMDAAVAPSESATTVTVADFAGDVEANRAALETTDSGWSAAAFARWWANGAKRAAEDAARAVHESVEYARRAGGHDDDAERNAVAAEDSKNDVARDETSKNEVAADDPGASSAFARENLARTAAAAMLSARRGMEGEDERAKTRRSIARARIPSSGETSPDAAALQRMIASRGATATGVETSAHARAFAAPPRPHLAAATAVGGAGRNGAALDQHVAGAGRRVPPREERPRVVRSTTRFL